jgi:predicted Fe-Mo cluster-binding NifX family protein
VKIAFASVGKGETSEISPRPGRSRFYLIFDSEGHLLEVLSNPFSRGGGGAGFGVAKMLADKRIDIVVAGQFGENLETALTARGLKYFEMVGNVKEALARFLGGVKE